MEAEEGVVASSAFAITSDGAQRPFVLSLPRQEPGTDASPRRQQDGPSMVTSAYPTQQEGPTEAAPSVPAHTRQPPTQMAGLTPTSVGTPKDVKKKRGRPRKYGPDGSVAAPSPMPISASLPLGRDCLVAWQGRSGESVKKKQRKMEFGSPGEKIAYFVGTNFTPHVLTFNTGEGRLEIVSLSGSYTPLESGGTASSSSGMSVSLAGPDGRVVGGGLAGLLVPAGPVQVVLGSFLPTHQLEQKPKKQRVDIQAATPPIITNIRARDETLGRYGGDEPIVSPAPTFKGEASVPFPDVRNATET